MPQKRTKKQPTIEEQLGPLRMANPVVQRALAEGLRVEPIPPEKVNEELHKIIQRSDQPEIVAQRYKVRYDEARTDAERKEVLREFSDKHHNTAMESKWFRERCAEHEMLESLGPTVSGADADSTSGLVGRGKFCQQMIDEFKRIKHLCLSGGYTVAEVEKGHPGFIAWKVRDSLNAEDRDIFNRPRQWGPVVGYARLVLSKHYGKSEHTIQSWVKAWRRSKRP